MTTPKPGFIRRLFSGLWRLLTWVRTSLSNLLFLLLLVVLVIALLPQRAAQMPQQTALRVAPEGLLVDQYSYIDPLTQLLNQSEASPETRVRDLVKAIDAGARDPRITALVLDLNQLQGGGLSKLQEVGAALQRFRDGGKPVYALSDNYSQDQYYLASYADEIMLHPMGAVMLSGYGSYRNYFKTALDKLAVNIHVFRVGEYKDAIEPFVRSDMSDASREHNRQWLSELWSTYTGQVERNRKLADGELNDYINRLDEHLQQHRGQPATAARELGLIDQLADHGQQRQWLLERLGQDEEEGDYQALDYDRYLNFIPPSPGPKDQQVGVLVASGMILDGQQPPGTIGSESLANLISSARNNPDLKALVVRIDSGGGSAFASEVIRQELELTRQQGIPVFVSMGSVAASGGYWIAMGADQVWATPTTLTGSIGVFSVFPTLENSLEKIGIDTDGIGTTELSGAMRLDLPMSELAGKVMQQSVNSIYQQFLQLVADNRQTTSAQVHAIGQGRVWSGRAARDLGLVDGLGDLQTVIAAAAAEAGLQEYRVVDIEKPLSPAEQLARQLLGGLAQAGTPALVRSSPLQDLLRHSERQLQPLVQLLKGGDPRGVYAHCLGCIAP